MTMNTFSGDRRRRGAKVFLMAAAWAALFAAVTLLVMLLWNWLLPALFVGTRSITFSQALGLLVLSRILFGGGHGRWKDRHRWHNMTHEEREQLKHQFKSRWGGGRHRSCGAEEAQAPESPASSTPSDRFRPRDAGSQIDKA
jgi:hypothetical protein